MSNWKIERDESGVISVVVGCPRCGRSQTSDKPLSFGHSHACGARNERPTEKILEAFAEVNEAGKQRVPKPMTRFQRNCLKASF